MTWIIQRLGEISDFFYELYLECYYAGFPLELLDSWFYAISSYFANLSWDFYYFSEWVNSVQAKVPEILNWNTIWSYILGQVPNLEAIRDWFYNWAYWVGQEISSWWDSTSLTVTTWIDEAKLFLQTQVDSLTSWLTTLQGAWDDFKGRIPSLDIISLWFANWWGNILANLATWWGEKLVEVESLINSAFTIRQDFWEGWQDWRDSIVEFFTDPEDWLYKAVDRIVERFW